MKKIFAISLIAMTAVTSARADIASQAYVDKQTGTLTNLTTEAKTNLVAAINEVKASAGGDVTALDSRLDTLEGAASVDGSVAQKIATALEAYTTTGADTTYAKQSDFATLQSAVNNETTGLAKTNELAVAALPKTEAASTYQTLTNLATTSTWSQDKSSDTKYASAKAVDEAITAAGGQTASDVQTAISTALANGNDAYQTASNVATTLGSYYTKTEADTQFVEQSQAATNAAAGIIKIATDTEATTGTAENVAVNPKQLKVVADTAAGGQTAQQVSDAIDAALANGGDAYQTAANVSTTLNDYYTKTAADAAFATTAQGAKADTALQQSNVAQTYDAAGTAPLSGAAVASAISTAGAGYATAAQGTKADSAVQSVTKTGTGNILSDITTTDNAVTVTVSGTAIPQPSGNCTDCVLHYNGTAYSWEEITR